MKNEEFRLNMLSEKIIGSAFEVSNVLGSGFLEKVYENALKIELKMNGLDAQQQAHLAVHYKGELVGAYFADLLVENAVIVEPKAVNALEGVHTAQCLNYLKGTGLKLCLLINFGKPKVEIKRLVNNI